jgi:membrane protein implicated in regulation of membrane protease activity
MSTPVVLTFGLAVIVLGFILLFTGIYALSYYTEISISVGYVFIVVFVLSKYRQFRKPPLKYYGDSTENERITKAEHTKLWNIESRYVSVSSLCLAIITVTNYWYGFLTAPIILILNGLFSIAIVYLLNQGPIDVAQLKAAASRLPGNKSTSTSLQTLINYCIVLALIAGYWTFQIQKTESELKQEGYILINELSDLAYCQDYQSKCVAVDKISQVSFKKIRPSDGPGKVWQMCFSLNYEYSPSI